MTVQVPSHVRLGTTSWDLAGSDGLGTPRDDPDFFGRGLSLTNSRFLGSGTFDSGIDFSRYQQKRKIEWPHKGFVWSYPITVKNDSVNIMFKHSIVPAGGLSSAVYSEKDAGIVVWYSRTPGGEPLENIGRQKLVFSMFTVEKINRFYQRYSVNDPKNSKGDFSVPGYDGDVPGGNSTELCIPIINKTYYINFAGVTAATSTLCATKTGNTINPNPRAPRADELVQFDATDIGGRPNLSFICQSATYWVDYDTYLRNVT